MRLGKRAVEHAQDKLLLASRQLLKLCEPALDLKALGSALKNKDYECCK
jgi:hypothetical protein